MTNGEAREAGTAGAGGLATDAGAVATRAVAAAGVGATGVAVSAPAIASATVPAGPARTATSTGHVAATLCANCGARLSGPFCAQCGQRGEHSVHSVWHFIREATEDLTHADSRLWRTLAALLFKPGHLTQQFLAGRRVSYLPPLRLYLVLSVAFFLLAATAGQGGSVKFVVVNPSDLTSTAAPALAREAAEMAAESLRQRNGRKCESLRYTGPWQSHLEPAMRTSCRRAVEDDGRELKASFFHNLPRAIFLTVPALALMLKPLYRRPRRYYIEHVLFVLHDHAFVFALLGLFSLVAAVLRVHALVTPLGFAIGCYIPCYYYLAMRRVYGQSPARTLSKLAVLALAYVVMATLVLLATALYAVLAQ